MDLRRVRAWDWVAGLAGAVLIGSLFLHWYRARGGGSLDAWQAFSVVDVILLIVGLFGIALVFANATQRTLAIPQALTTMSVLPAIAGAVLAIYKAASLPGSAAAREGGVWVGLAAALVLLAACMKAMSDQRAPRAPVPRVETISAPEAK